MHICWSTSQLQHFGACAYQNSPLSMTYNMLDLATSTLPAKMALRRRYTTSQVTRKSMSQAKWFACHKRSYLRRHERTPHLSYILYHISYIISHISYLISYISYIYISYISYIYISYIYHIYISHILIQLWVKWLHNQTIITHVPSRDPLALFLRGSQVGADLRVGAQQRRGLGDTKMAKGVDQDLWLIYG